MIGKFVRDYVEAYGRYWAAKNTAESMEASLKKLQETRPLFTEEEFVKRMETFFDGAVLIHSEKPAEVVLKYAQLRAEHEVAQTGMEDARNVLASSKNELKTAMTLLLNEIKPAPVSGKG